MDAAGHCCRVGAGWSTYVNQARQLAVAAGWVAKQQGDKREIGCVGCIPYQPFRQDWKDCNG